MVAHAADQTSGTTGGRLPAASRRRQLLAVARTVFGQKGFHQTTMADIATAAGVTKPVLYQHFSSKRDLYTAVLEAIGSELEQAIEEADSHATSSRERSDLGFRAYVRFVEADPVGFRLLFSSATRQDKEWAAISNDVQRAIAEGIAERIKVTGVDDAHRMVLAHGIMGLAEGMMRYWHSGAVDDSVAFDDLLTDLQALAWGGIRNIGT